MGRSKKLFIHLSICFLLFGYQLSTPSIQQKKNLSSLYSTTWEHKLISKLSNWKHALLLQAYVTGEKASLDRQTYLQHKKFYLLHLFTPSALHLSIILTFILYLLGKVNISKTLHSPIRILLNILIYISFPMLTAIHRITIFNILKILKPHLDPYPLLLISFVIDYLTGGYIRSPFSFHYSFLFLGMIVLFSYYSPLKLFIALLYAQLTLSYITAQNFSLLYFAFGFLYTSLFSFIFPLLVLYYYYPTLFLAPLIRFIFSIQEHALSHPLPSLHISVSMITLFSVFIWYFPASLRKYVLIIFLMFYSIDLINFPDAKFLKTRKKKVAIVKLVTKDMKHAEYYERGIKITYKKRVCYHTLYLNYYKRRCLKL